MESTDPNAGNMGGLQHWDGGEDGACPICGIANDCEHLLLRVDITFQEATGGKLFEKFRVAVSCSLGTFDELLDQAGAVSQTERSFEFEGGPGQSCDYQSYYHKDASTVADEFTFSKP